MAPDIYTFRVYKLQTDGTTWLPDPSLFGPEIDRLKHQVFSVTQLHYLDIEKDKQMMIVCSLQGNETQKLSTVVQGMILTNKNPQNKTVWLPSWTPLHSRPMEYLRNFETFNSDILQDRLAQISDTDKRNQIINIHQKQLLSLDWDDDMQRVYSFNTLD